jgi:hypothetical protein
MAEFPVQTVARQRVLVRAVNAMIRAIGGAAVKIRLVSAGTASNLERELGVIAAVRDEMEIAPVVVRSVGVTQGRERIEVLISTSTLEPLMLAHGVTDGRDWLRTSDRLVYEGRAFSVIAVESESFAGLEYMYRVEAAANPEWERTMQFAKDSFYVALRDRLSTLNPERTVVVDGVARPAIVVTENESDPAAAGENVFRITWAEAERVASSDALMKAMCLIRYATHGADDTGGNRGRSLGELDAELASICQPPRTQKMDYSKIPAGPLGTMMFWTDLEFREPNDEAGLMEREARTTLYFFSEVKQ